MRLIYFGSAEFGLPSLKALHAEHHLICVISQPDRPAGRGRKLTPTPIARWAHAAGVEVLKTANTNEASFVEQVAQKSAEASVVIGFGQKLSKPLITAAGRLVINLHGSLLPKYRGAAPIQWAMLDGERETGLSVISLSQTMDAGLIYAKARTAIEPGETAGELHDRLALMGPQVIENVLSEFQVGTLQGEAQDESRASHAPKLSKADRTIHFDTTAESVRGRVHGLTPWPGAVVQWKCKADDQRRPLVLRRVEARPGLGHDCNAGTVLLNECVAVGDGAIRLLEVQLPGRRLLSIHEFIRGYALLPGDQLMSPS